MTDDLKQIWQAEGAAETFTKPENLMDRSSTFERKIRRRNILEYAAGVLVLLASVPTCLMFAGMGEWLLAGSMGLMVPATLFVLWNLHRRASNLARRPEEDCRSHLSAQYRRQAEALRKVPLWYVAPFVPSVLGVYGTVAIKAMGVRPAAEIIERIGLPLGARLAFFGFVIWLNLRAAKALQRQAEELEQA